MGPWEVAEDEGEDIVVTDSLIESSWQSTPHRKEMKSTSATTPASTVAPTAGNVLEERIYDTPLSLLMQPLISSQRPQKVSERLVQL